MLRNVDVFCSILTSVPRAGVCGGAAGETIVSIFSLTVCALVDFSPGWDEHYLLILCRMVRKLWAVSCSESQGRSLRGTA